MELSEIRAVAERLTHHKVRGVITASKKHPNHFQIHLDETTASQLWTGPITGDASLACIQQKDAWIVTLIDAGEPKAYWTDLPDETNRMQGELIRLLLEGRFQVGDIQPTRLMYDHVRDVRQTFFETAVGPMILHSRRIGAETKRTRYVLEVSERKLFLEFFWHDNLVDLNDVHELPGLPDLCPKPKPPSLPRIAAADAGRYFAPSAVAIYDFALQDLRACWERFGEAVPAGSEGRFTWRLRAGQQSDPRCLALILGAVHERNHFVQSMSTPCGLLQWRIFQAIVSTAGWLTRKLVEKPRDCAFHVLAVG